MPTSRLGLTGTAFIRMRPKMASPPTPPPPVPPPPALSIKLSTNSAVAKVRIPFQLRAGVSNAVAPYGFTWVANVSSPPASLNPTSGKSTVASAEHSTMCTLKKTGTFIVTFTLTDAKGGIAKSSIILTVKA